MKHELGDTLSGEPTSKRAKGLPPKAESPLDVLTAPDEAFSQADVVYYQKEAIFRQWSGQMSKNKRLQLRFNHLRAKYDNVFGYYQVLTRWWTQLVDNLKLVASDDAALNEDVLVPVEAAMANGCDEQTVQDLNNLRTELVKLISPLFKSATPNASADDVIQLNQSIANLNIVKDRLLSENDDLKSNLNDLNNQVDTLLKKLDRQNSATLNRLKAAATNEEDDSREPSVKTEAQPVQGSQPAHVSEQTVHELEDLKIKLAEFEAKVSFLNERLDEKVAKISDLETQLESKPQAQPIVKEPQSEDHMNNKIIELENSKKKLEVQMLELESGLTNQKSKYEEKTKAEIEQANGLIKKLEQDVNRLRAERDSSLTKLNILKSEKGSSELLESYQSLITTLEERVAKFESQRETDFTNLAKDDLNKLLTDELKQMEMAFKNTRELTTSKLKELKDYQIIINKLQVEKAKADEKYFQAMRTNDSMSNQNKILQTNLNKQMELIELLRDEEKGLKRKLEIETKLFDKLASIENKYNHEVMKFKTKFEKAEKAAIYESNKSKALVSEVTKLKAENGKLEKSLATANENLSGAQSKSSKLEILVNKYRTNSRTEEDEEINQALLNMTKCQLCTKNFKEVALKTCGHCFCRACIDDRLNSRMRKCPNCNSQFSRYDLLHIHL